MKIRARKNSKKNSGVMAKQKAEPLARSQVLNLLNTNIQLVMKI